MTTKPSSAPWADEPFRLIVTPSKRLDVCFDQERRKLQSNLLMGLQNSLGHVYCASEMAHAHNTLIRGLNSILQQAPHVPIATDDKFNSQDVKDLLFYVHSWAKMVNHHHWVEESYIFPELEKSTGRQGLMDDPKHQHELFHDGMETLLEYSAATTPENYRWQGPDGMKEIIDSFSKYLTDHLYAEIDIFLGMEDLDGTELRKTWQMAEKIAQQAGNLAMLYDVFPTVLGCADKTYEGGHDFPPLPFVMPYMVKYWFAAGNGAWRFNPCDWWGQPRPLAFVGSL